MRKTITRIFLILVLLESLIVSAATIIRINKSGGFQSILDWLNLAPIIFLFGVVILCVWVFIRTFKPTTEQIWIDRLGDNKKLYWGIVAFLSLVLMESAQDILFLNANLKEIYYPVVLRENQLVLFWAAIVSAECLVALILLGWKNKTFNVSIKRDLIAWLAIGSVIGLVIIFSGSGASLPTNAPVPFLHILIVLFSVLFGAYLTKYLLGKSDWLDRIIHLDLIPFLILWVLAFLLWAKVDIEPNYFIDIPRPPNYEYSPTSDAGFYEIQAQRFLAGEGFEDQAQHSLYGYLLSGLHWLGGNHFEDIYKLQITLLAVIPFLLFKLTNQLGPRFSGWMLAGLFILRERNALLLGDSITVSNVQVLMTEPVTVLGVVLSIYLMVVWLKNPSQNRGFPFLIGSVIGLVALFRVELLSLLIVYGLISLLVLKKSGRNWLYPTLITLVTISLVITPWIVRNYQKTGTISLDKGIVIDWAIRRYINQDQQGDPNQPQSEDQDPGILQRININQFKRIAVHSGNSLQQSIVYLPSNHLFLGGIDTFLKIVPEKRKVFLFEDGLISDKYITSYIKSLPYWHVRWDGEITPRSIIPLLFSIVCIVLGLKFTWSKYHWVGLLPLSLMVLHIIIYAFFIGSGGRYIQVVDWITLLYFCIGLACLVDWICRIIAKPEFTDGNDPSITGMNLAKDAYPISQRVLFGWGILIILVGISLPIVEASIPKRYTQESLGNRLSTLTEQGVDIPSTLDDVGQGGLTDSRLEILYGEALYPNFFEADEDILDDRSGRIPEAGLPRTVFNLVGTTNIWVSLPISVSPVIFPHGSEVVVLGNITRDSEELLAVKLQPYFLAEQVFILPVENQDSDIIHLKCDLENCQP